MLKFIWYQIKNINFLENQTMNNISSLYLDNNLIEDISIFGKINYNFFKLSIKQNPIRKGIDVLNSKYFKCIYIEIDISKMEKEYKICSCFKFPTNSCCSTSWSIRCRSYCCWS